MGGEYEDTGKLDATAIGELAQIHLRKRLELAFTVGLSGAVHLAGDPQGLVTELLRLAHVGAIAEAAARHDGGKPIRLVTADARRTWLNPEGGR